MGWRRWRWGAYIILLDRAIRLRLFASNHWTCTPALVRANIPRALYKHVYTSLPAWCWRTGLQGRYFHSIYSFFTFPLHPLPIITTRPTSRPPSRGKSCFLAPTVLPKLQSVTSTRPIYSKASFSFIINTLPTLPSHNTPPFTSPRLLPITTAITTTTYLTTRPYTPSNFRTA